MTEPQVWTLIGVFAAGLFGMLTLMSTMFVRVVRTEIGSVRTEIGSYAPRCDPGLTGCISASTDSTTTSTP